MKIENQIIHIRTLFFIILCTLIGFVRIGVTQNLSPMTEDSLVDESPPKSWGAYMPAIAYNPRSNIYMIAWVDEVAPGVRKIYGRIFDQSGNPMTKEFKIDLSSEKIEDGGGRIDLAIDSFDNFWVVWEDRRNSPDYQIYARIISSKGEPVSKELTIETTPENKDISGEPAIAISPQNTALIAWINDSDGQQSIHGRFIQIQAPGQYTLNDEFLVNTNNTRTSRSANQPKIAVTSEGNFVITWRDNRYEYQPNQGLSLIYARRYHYSGEVLGPAFLVNELVPETFVSYSDPDIAFDQNDNIIFVWNDGRYFSDKGPYFTYFRKFAWDETSLTGDIQVDSCNSSDSPRIATDQDNNFIIVYSRRSTSRADPDTAFDHLYAKRYNEKNELTGREWMIDQGGTVQFDTEHAHIINTNNSLITAWTTNRLEMPQETFTSSVYMNIYGIQSPPASPSNLKAEKVDTNQILWTWNDNSDDETYFQMKNENDLAISPFLNPNTQSWEEVGLSSNLRVSRKIVAGNFSGESQPSELVSVFTLAIAPTNLRVISTTDSTVELAWDGGNPTRYAIEKALDNNGQPGNFSYIVTWNDSLTQTNFIDTQVEPVTAYWYRVRGYNGDQILTAATRAIYAVTDYSFVAPPSHFIGTSTSPTTILWTWKDNSNNEHNFYLEDSSGQFISDYLPADTTSWLETGLNPNTLYMRRVRAISDTAFASEASNFHTVCTLAIPPSELAVFDISSNSILLKWSGNGATQFAIDKALSIAGKPAEWTALLDWESNWNKTEYKDTSLAANTIYWYRVRSYNQFGNINNDSAVIQITTLAFTSPIIFQGTVLSTASIEWTWQHETQQKITYIIFSEKEISVSPQLTSDTKSWTETKLDSNTQYIRFIKAFAADSIQSSNLDSVYTLAKIPTDLNVNRFDDKAQLDWNGQGGSRFAVQRAVDEDANPGMWQYIATWANNVTASFFQDDSLDRLLSYWYRVQAYNGDQIATEPSEPVLATPVIPEARRGDIDTDGKIDLVDLDRLVQIILEISPPITQAEIYPADCYEDGQHNIHDIIWIVNRILGIPMLFDNAAFSTIDEKNSIILAKTTLPPNRENRIPVILKNSVCLKSLQLQFEIGKEVKIENASLASQIDGMTLSSVQTDDQFRVLIYNINNASYVPGETELATLLLAPQSEVKGFVDICIAGAVALDTEGNLLRLSVSNEHVNITQKEFPEQFVLNQNYPNPFNSVTEISFQCPEKAGEVSLKIFDLMGHEITTLLNGRPPAGIVRVRWNGRDFAGRNVSSGLYFYQLNASGFQSTKKLLLIR